MSSLKSIIADIFTKSAPTLPEPPAPQDAGVGVFHLGETVSDWKNPQTQYSEGYLINPYVRQACDLYGVRISSVDHQAYNEVHDDITEKGHRFIELMDHPNPGMSRHDMFNLIGIYLGIYGEAFLYPHRVAMGFDAIYVIDPKLMTAQVNANDLVNPVNSWRCTKYIEGVNTFLPQDLIHIKLPDPDMGNVRGLSKMASCGKNVEMMNAIKDWNIATTNNGAKPSIGLKIPQRLTPEDRNILKAEMRAGYQGTKNAGNGIILDDGKDVSVLGMTAVEMDYQQGLVNAAKEIAIAYGIPPEMMGDSANKTYSNAQEASRQVVVNTIRPLLDLVYSSIWQFFRDEPFANGISEYTYDEEQLSDFIGVQIDLYNALQQASFLTINDKREKLGYDRIEEPLADQVMMGMTDIPLSEYSADDLDPGRNDPSKDDMQALLGNIGL